GPYAGRLFPLKRLKETFQLATRAGRRQRRLPGKKADGIPLTRDQISESGGECFGVFEFRQPAVGGKTHGSGVIENDGSADVGLLLVLANNEAVGTAEDFPIE